MWYLLLEYLSPDDGSDVTGSVFAGLQDNIAEAVSDD